MRIHYYAQFFPGVASPGSQQPMALARLLAERGHEVSVLSSNYNIDTELTEEAIECSGANGGFLRVFRFETPRGARGGLATRLRTYVSFMFRVWREGMKLERPDLVVGSIQPLFTGWAAMRVAMKKNVPFLLEVRDLWPDALEVKGAITGWRAKPLHWIADALYRNACRIVSITPGIKKELVKKGLDSRKVDVFPNGFDPRLFDLREGTRMSVRAQYGWGADFVAIYTGVHSSVTATDVIVRAAHALRERANIRFELFGEGPTKKAVVRAAEALRLNNIHFHDAVPKHEVPRLLAGADVALMCLFKSPLVHIYFENKFIDYMAAAKPILAAMEGEQAALIREGRTGRVVPALDHDGLARLVAEAADNYAPFAEMGENGKQLVSKRFPLPVILDRYARTVECVAAGQSNALPAWEP